MAEQGQREWQHSWGSRTEQENPGVRELREVTPSINLCYFCFQRWQGKISDSELGSL